MTALLAFTIPLFVEIALGIIGAAFAVGIGLLLLVFYAADIQDKAEKGR